MYTHKEGPLCRHSRTLTPVPPLPQLWNTFRRLAGLGRSQVPKGRFCALTSPSHSMPPESSASGTGGSKRGVGGERRHKAAGGSLGSSASMVSPSIWVSPRLRARSLTTPMSRSLRETSAKGVHDWSASRR